MRLIAIAVLSLSTVISVENAYAQNFQIPPKYWGEYNSNLAHCGTELNDSRLRVSWDTMRFYESEATLKSLITQPDGSTTLMLQFSGEGETWIDMIQLKLSSDGKSLTIIHGTDPNVAQIAFTRKRCS